MANQYVNEVIYNGNTLISLKEDTVQASDVLAGKRFHMADGSIAIGTGSSSSAGCTLTVIGEAGDTVKITKEGEADKDGTLGEDGTATFTGLSNGVWTITMSDETDTVSKDLNITTEYDITLSYFTATISVTYPKDSTCTVLKEGETEPTPAPDRSGIWNCIVFSKGNYTFTCTNDAGDSASDVVIAETNGQSSTLILRYAKIYGIKRNINDTSPDWTRTDDSLNADGTEKTATATNGTSAGSSDFDSCYPWSGIARSNSYTSTGDWLVKIPKFWYQRKQVVEEGATWEYIRIADKPVEGFKLHPAFNHVGFEDADCIYVGAYKTSVVNNAHKSASGQAPKASLKRSEFRTNAKKATGWSIIDISTLSAIQMLILVEFASNNVQNKIGMGYVGGSAAVKTGQTDSVTNLTGSKSMTSKTYQVVWRGIEDLWGNLWEWVDGVNWEDGVYSICNNPSAYTDNVNSSKNANYSELKSTGVTNWYSSYITQESYEEGEFDWVMLPTAATAGTDSTHYCDACWSSTGQRVFRHGGEWSRGTRCGLFAAALNVASSSLDTIDGCRLIYIPSSTSTE